MGCSHSELITVTKNAVSPSQFLDRHTTESENSSSLTQDQLEKVQVVWKLIGDDKEFLLLVMIRLFVMHPHLREKWIFARDLQNEEEIRNNPQVKYHASKIAQLFSRIICEINTFNNQDLTHISNLGRNHHSYGVRPEDFQHFEESLFYCFEQKLSERVFNEAAQKAWKKFFWKMVGKLCEGIYLAEIDEFHKSNQTKKSASFKNL